MTTVHHPPLKEVDFQHNLNWLLIGLSNVLVVLAIGVVAWTMSRPATTGPAVIDTITGAELDNEATVGHVQSPGVTTQYLGFSGELDDDE